MPTAIYDASYATFRKRAGVLSAYNDAINAYRSGTDRNIVRSEQPTFQTAEIIITRKQGPCFCAQDISGIPFNRAPSGACSCAR